ncbi:hypothetical protein ElyMa_004444600 [Elysia marginata]|uniref:Uncharacterized protein n=1 Tax=Elysia marginata TaxID=1093978 RepID=A0AAV4HGZ8_9GAST|nr:hypothetical protein ElyMa_004444600 [Elysia marginata]
MSRAGCRLLRMSLILGNHVQVLRIKRLFPGVNILAQGVGWSLSFPLRQSIHETIYTTFLTASVHTFSTKLFARGLRHQLINISDLENSISITSRLWLLQKGIHNIL